LRETKTDWDARLRKKEMDAQAAAAAPDTTAPTATDGKGAVKLNSNTGSGAPVFDPGNTFNPPHTELAPTIAAKKLSDAALCLIWVNNDCEIAALDEKYLRLNGTIDPATHEWHLTDRAKLDALLQSAEGGARQGIAFAEKAEVDSSVLAMIYERASHLRIQTDDTSALEALRQYWRCALLGNMCWQLAHTHKAQPVDLTQEAAPAADDKTPKKDDKTAAPDKGADKSKTPVASSSSKTSTPVKNATPEPPKVAPAASNNNVVVVTPPLPPIAPIAPKEEGTNSTPPRALPVVDDSVPNPPASVPAPPVPVPPTPPSPPAPVPQVVDEANIPVAPVAKVQDYVGAPPTTNAAPIIGPVPPKNDNADSHSF
jgi:hypothetical protein